MTCLGAQKTGESRHFITSTILVSSFDGKFGNLLTNRVDLVDRLLSVNVGRTLLLGSLSSRPSRRFVVDVFGKAHTVDHESERKRGKETNQSERGKGQKHARTDGKFHHGNVRCRVDETHVCVSLTPKN